MSHQGSEPRMVLDLLDVSLSQASRRFAHEGHHEVHALRGQASSHVVRDVKKLKSFSTFRVVDLLFPPARRVCVYVEHVFFDRMRSQGTADE